MTIIRINELEDLLNKLDFKLIQLQSVVTVANNSTFLDNTKAIIAAYLSIIDEKVGEIVDINDKIFNKNE